MPYHKENRKQHSSKSDTDNAHVSIDQNKVPYRKEDRKQHSSKLDTDNAHGSIDQNKVPYRKENRKQHSSKSDTDNAHVSMKTFLYRDKIFPVWLANSSAIFQFTVL